MAPQPLYQGKRTLRRRRRRNSTCPRCRSQEEGTSGGGLNPYGSAGPGSGYAHLLRPQKLWESRSGETAEYFMKLSTIILAVVSSALAVALIAVHYSKTARIDQLRADVLRMSNDWTTAQAKLSESGKLVEVLQTELAARSAALATFSNDVARLQAELGKVSLDLAGARAEIGKGQARILQLEGERDDMAKRMEDLNGSIAKLEGQIADTEEKLKTERGDKAVLLAELKRLQDERADLMTQFNNLAALQTQIAKLREEQAIKQRMDWHRTGVYTRQEQKGAERLMAQRYGGSWTRPDNRMIIELERTGASRVVIPAGSGAPSR